MLGSHSPVEESCKACRAMDTSMRIFSLRRMVSVMAGRAAEVGRRLAVFTRARTISG